MNLNENFINSLPDMLKPLVVPATLLHVDYLAPRLRQADVDELKAVRGYEVRPEMTESLCTSAFACTFLNPATRLPQTMAGLALIENGYGVPWAFGAKFDKPATRFFLAISPLVIEYMLEQARCLVNFVDARNKKAIRWLEWAGFSLGNEQPWGVEQKDFIKFTMWGNEICAEQH